jgi:hypothetical protein
VLALLAFLSLAWAEAAATDGTKRPNRAHHLQMFMADMGHWMYSPRLWPSNPRIDSSAGSPPLWLDDRHLHTGRPFVHSPRPPGRNGRKNEPTNQSKSRGQAGARFRSIRARPCSRSSRPRKKRQGQSHQPKPWPVDWIGSASSRWCRFGYVTDPPQVQPRAS